MGFCDDDMWKKIISCSQAPLIDGDFLQEFASSCRKRFDQESKEIHYQDVPQSAVNNSLAEKICSIRSGYDLPISIRKNGEGRYIALVFQDPLRPPSASDTLTIGVPFALSNRHMRQRKRYQFIWRLIEKITALGYGVWVTDANKLWFNPKGKKNTFYTDELKTLSKSQIEILEKELAQVDPLLTVAFGKGAQKSLDRCKVTYAAHPHPAVFGGRPLESAYGLTKGNFDYESRLAAAWVKIENDIEKSQT